MRRVKAALVGLVTTASVLGATAMPVSAAVACSVRLDQWNSGYVAYVTVTNTGTSAVSSWSVNVTLNQSTTVTNSWNVNLSGSGASRTGTNVSWNGNLGVGSSADFGFQGSSSGSVSATCVETGGTTTTTQGTTTTTRATTTTTRATTTTTRATTTTTRATTTTTRAVTTTTQVSGSCGTGSFDAEVTVAGSTWTARRGSQTVYTGNNMLAAMQAGANSLTAGRTSKQSMVVRGSGTMSANERFTIPSYTILDVCGTINVTGSGSGDMAPVYGRNVRDIEIRYLTLTGAPRYGIFIRNGENIHMGQIDMRLSGGLGVRIDNHGDRSVRTRNVRIDNVYVSGTSAHGVETYGVDNLTIGTVTARNTAYSGLILNDTINATIGTVDGSGTGTGTGYAAFRMANRNGRVGSSYPTNIRVGTVIARGGGRGIFCVSESGGAVIDRVDIRDTGNNAILIENCYNVNIAAVSGIVSGGGEVRIAARSEFANNSDITIQNLTLTNNRIVESPCGVRIVVRNNTLINSSLNICSGSNGGGN